MLLKLVWKTNIKLKVLIFLLPVFLFADAQEAIDNVRFQMGLQQLREHNRKQIQIRNENIKNYNKAIKKQKEAKKQKLIDANEEARRANEAYAKKLNSLNEEEITSPILIIKRTKQEK